MAYTVSQIIAKAYYLTGIVSKDFETVSGPQYAEGLDCLNDILGDQTSDKSMIPYFTSGEFNTIIGQETYFIQNLVEVTSLTFTLATVRYAMQPVMRDAYWGLPRAQSIQSLPFNYNVERTFDPTTMMPGCNINLYFLPQQVYLMQWWGKFALAYVTLNQDLSLTIDRFYINYLKYALAERLCNDYNYEVPQSVMKMLNQYELEITKKSAILDLRTKKTSTLTPQDIGLNYAQVNLGKGFTVP
jgi:hypothetical protein